MNDYVGTSKHGHPIVSGEDLNFPFLMLLSSKPAVVGKAILATLAFSLLPLRRCTTQVMRDAKSSRPAVLGLFNGPAPGRHLISRAHLAK